MVTRTRQELKGLRQLGEAMKALGDDMGLKVARSATAAAAQPIKKRAKEIVRAQSYDNGYLFEAIITKRRPRGETNLTSEHIVTVRGRGKKKKDGSVTAYAPHASNVEFGTVHMAPEPYLRPAFEQEKGAALDAMVKRLKTRVDKANKTTSRKR